MSSEGLSETERFLAGGALLVVAAITLFRRNAVEDAIFHMGSPRADWWDRYATAASIAIPALLAFAGIVLLVAE